MLSVRENRCSQVRTAENTFTRASGKLLSLAAGVLVLFLANSLFAQVGANVLVANPDYYAVAENGTLSVPAATGLLKNDYSSNGVLYATSYSAPSHGTLSLYIDGSFTYTPDIGYVGTDSISYTISNGSIQTSGSVTFTSYHPAPVAEPDVYTLESGTTRTVSAAEGLLANDLATAGTLHATSYTAPAHGTLSVFANGSLIYTPNAGYAGTDTFNYTMTDGTMLASATASFVVTAVAPVANNDYYAVRAGQTLSVGVTNGLLANDSNLQGTEQVTSYSGASHGTLSVHIDGSFTYTSDPGFVGTDTAAYTVGNGTLTSTAALTIQVVDHPPVVNTNYYCVTKNGTLNVSATRGLLLNDFDPDGDAVSVTSYVPTSHGVLSVFTTGGFIYTPDTNFSGTDVASYTISDGILQASGTLNIDVVGTSRFVNIVLVAAPDYYSVAENGTLSEPAASGLLQNDYSSNGALSVSSNTAPAHGTLVVSADGSFTYTPNAGYAGTDAFSYTISDGLLTQSSSVTFTVYHPAPVAEPDVYTLESGTTRSVSAAVGLLANDFAITGTLQVTSYTAPAHGTLSMFTDGRLIYTPDAGFVGTDAASYTESDGIAQASSTVSFVVTAVAPVANNDYYAVRAGQTLSVGVTNGLLANDSNLQGTEQVISYTAPAHGTLSVSANGSFTYTPNAGFTGTETVNCHVSNGILMSTAALTIQVVDHPPVANPDYYYVTQNGTLNVSATNGLLLNDFDPDGDAVRVTSYVSTSHGTLSMYTPGSFTYTPDAGFVGTDTASYTMSDGILSASANLVINVVGSRGLIQNLSFGSKGLKLDCSGYPGTTYDVQRATNVAGPWTTLTTQTCPTNGLFNFTDRSPPQPDAFYRLK